MTLADIQNSIYRRTKTNATSFTGANMILAINSAYNRVLSVVRKYVDNYRPTAWTSTDLSTGTAVPFLDADFHEAIPIWASYEYAVENGSPNSQLLLDEFLRIEKEIESFYGTRNYNVFTVTIASPCVVTKDNHELSTDDRVSFITSGALPTGLSADTYYYVIYVTEHTFQLSSTRSGTAINTSGTQSGTHYYFTDGLVGRRMKPNSDSNK